MKLLKVFSGLVFASAAFISLNSSADTLVPVSCSWNVTQVVNIPVNPGGTITVSSCTDTATNTVAATKAIGSNGNTTCGLSASTGYQVQGNCYSPSVFKVVVTPPSACPYAGQVYSNSLAVGMGQPPFPYSQVNSFCGINSYPASCTYSATTISSSPYGAVLRVTCVSK
jgi:hypothetical protein